MAVNRDIRRLGARQRGSRPPVTPPGRGRKAMVRLSPVRAAGRPAGAAASADTGAPSATARLLLVDDEQDLRLLYADEFAEAGYEIKTAGSCAEASELLRTFHFDLLILDIQLNRESGLQILQQVAREQPQLPVILCTAFSCYLDDFTAWRADACIIKSSDFSPLKNEVRRQLASRGKAG